MNRQDLRTLAEEAHPNLSSYRNCGAINREITKSLKQRGDLTVKQVDGTLTEYGMRGHGPEHTFILVYGTDFSNQPVIIDGALDQFCEENKEEGLVLFSLGPKENFETVEILTPNDDLYGAYVW